MHYACNVLDLLHFHMWTEYFSDSIGSAAHQSRNGFHYILFNSTTSWQMRHWFKFRSKPNKYGVCDDSPGRRSWKWATHEQSRMKTLFDPVGCAEECTCTCNVGIMPMKMHTFTYMHASHSASEATVSVIAAERGVVWVVTVHLGPMKDELLPQPQKPGWPSLLFLTSLPGSRSSSSSLLLFCSP